MNLCSDGHDEICYECTYCPLCEKINEKNDMESELNEKILEAEENGYARGYAEGCNTVVE
jgi:hypothetical protein